MHSRVLAALCPLAASVSAFAPPLPPGAASVAVLAIDGRGFGHGVGMPQDGAFWMAKGGATTNAILGHFYPGTSLGRATGSVRVEILTSPTQDAILAFPEGGQVRDGQSGATSAGFPISVPPGGQVRVWFDGARYFASQPLGSAPRARSGGAGGGYVVARTARTPAQGPIPTTPTTAPQSTTTLLPRRPPVVPTTTTAPPPASTAPKPSTPKPATPTPPASAARPLWAIPATGATVAVPARQRQYRGSLEAVAAPGVLRLVDQLDVEQYLLGMGEVRDASWPSAALQAQAIVARTYALRAMAASGELCDTDRCQVYLGQQAEYGAMTKAVSDTRGRVVVYGIGLASTVYSSNGGGVSATPEEGFGTSAKSYPYLRSVRYTTNDPGPWTVRVALGDIASRLGYKGEVTGARVTKTGPSGRATEITLDGSSGAQAVEGTRFATSLGLRSTLFSFRVEQAATAPPPPPPADFLQAPPEQLPGAAATEAPPESAAAPVAQAKRLRAPQGRDRRALIVITGLALAALMSATAAFRRPHTPPQH
jgi:stage II sporulation protein D